MHVAPRIFTKVHVWHGVAIFRFKKLFRWTRNRQTFWFISRNSAWFPERETLGIPFRAISRKIKKLEIPFWTSSRKIKMLWIPFQTISQKRNHSECCSEPVSERKKLLETSSEPFKDKKKNTRMPFKKQFFAEFRSVPNLGMGYSETHRIPRKEDIWFLV